MPERIDFDDGLRNIETKAEKFGLRRIFQLVGLTIFCPGVLVGIYNYLRSNVEQFAAWQLWLLFSTAILIVVGIIYVLLVSARNFRHSVSSDNDSIYNLSKATVVLALFSANAVTFPFFFAIVFLELQRHLGECIEGFADGWDALYFSYTTTTTLGYGDLKPVGVCRIVSSFAAVFGLTAFGLFTATLFALITMKKRRN